MYAGGVGNLSAYRRFAILLVELACLCPVDPANSHE
jgi:hypothetical protein